MRAGPYLHRAGLFAYRAKNLAQMAAFMTAHPTEISMLPRWIRQRRSSLLDIRVPWWPYRAAAYVAQHLPLTAHVFEFGGGGSTLWLEDLGAKVTTVEHDENWFKALQRVVSPRTRLLFRPPVTGGRLQDQWNFDHYVAAIDEVSANSLDLVIVDGRSRLASVLRSIEKIKPGGILLLDDSDRPRYQEAHTLLAGWYHTHIRGLKPGDSVISQTSIWQRPVLRKERRSAPRIEVITQVPASRQGERLAAVLGDVGRDGRRLLSGRG
jgi:hypothetical protein